MGPLSISLALSVSLALALVVGRGGGASAAPQDPEADAVRATVELYFRGHATGNGDYYKRAFHGDARLFWVQDGALAQKTSAEFVAGAPGKPPEDEAKRVRRITLVDVSGDAAIAKVELDYPTVRFVDYLSLLKIGGTWVIVNKTFHRSAPAVRSR
jgi:hypothetical protein